MSGPASKIIAAIPSDLKLSNRMQILEIFKAGGEYTANHIAEEIGVSRQTVMKAIQFFVQKGLIVSTGKADSTNVGGKRPELFSLSADKYLLSVSLWPDRLHLTLLNFRFEIIDQYNLPKTEPAGVDDTMATIGRLSGEMLAQCGVDPERLCGVCISTSGIVDYKTSTLKYNSHSPAWGRNIPLHEKLRPYFAEGTPILAENVAKVVGRSILHEKELRAKRMMTVFSSWGGVCACFIERDQIQNGKDSLIGEIGHMVLAPGDTEQCGCGSHGCFERLVSNERIRDNIRRHPEGYADSLLHQYPLDQLTVAQVFEASEHEDAYARCIVRELARYFAMALRNVTLVFDPEIVVFHGEYAAADAYFQEEFQHCLKDFQYYPEQGPFTLRLDRRSIQELDIRGAYTLLLDHIFSDSNLYV